MWDDERAEAALDEAARQMTAGELPADFRARVLARIETRAGVGLGRPAFAALSVAALIVVGLVVSRERIRPGHRPDTGSPPTTSP